MAGPTVRSDTSDADLFTAWSMQELSECPTIGPVVYSVLGERGAVMWVGSTGQPLRDRVRTHLRDPAKAQSFRHVAAIPLDVATPQWIVGAVERRGKLLLDPLMGDRWPRVQLRQGRC